MTTLSRRALFSGLAAAPALAALPRLAAAETTRALTPPPPIARRRVGRFEVFLISDGYIEFPYAAFTGADPAEVERLAATRFAARPEGVRGAFNVWLIRDGERLILVDSGPAGTVSKTSGWLPQALAALGVSPSDIDAVIATHMHVDHISGLVAGGRAVFAESELYIHRADIAHFTDSILANAAPDLLRSSFAAAAQVVSLYPRLQRVDAPREISRGVSLVDLAGHTPGHVGVRIEDGDQAMVLVADMLFDPALHPERPDIGILFEADAEAAAASRARFFPQAADEGALLAATHMPFPGVGRIARDGGRLTWIPADWDLGA